MIAIELITPANVTIFKDVRLAALQDTPTAFAATYAKETLLSDAYCLSRAHKFSSETSVGYLAMDGRAGVGIARGTRDDLDPKIAWLESMWVAPSYRRRGVGQLLVSAILKWARSREFSTVKLMVTSTNDPANRFYERVGFRPTGNAEPYPNDPALVECEMSHSLE